MVVTLKKLLLVDGNSILNRAYYGIRPLTTSKGLPVNALYGMLNILQKQLDQISPDFAAVAFDVSKHTFRHDRYEHYKAGRKPMPEELVLQLPYAHKLVEALGFHVVFKQDYEADDLLGTYSMLAEKAGIQSYVFTGDRDSLQLISPLTTVILATNKDNINFDSDEFVKNYGIPPSQFVYVKALMGDSSDNIRGVAGIGEKTALKLISQFGSLDALYADIRSADVGASAKAKLEAGKESAYESLWLATIDRSVPVEKPLSELEYNGWNRKELYSLLSEFEFVNHIKKFALTSSDAVNSEETTVSSENEALKPESKSPKDDTSQQQKTIDIDDLSELSSSQSAMMLYIPSLQPLATSENTTVTAYLCDTKSVYRLKRETIKQLFSELSEYNVPLAVYDLKAILNELARQFPEYSPSLNVCDDIMLAGYVVNPASHSYDQESLCTIYLGETLDPAPETAATQLYRVRNELRERLSESSQLELYENIELRLARVLSEMEQLGFKVNTDGLNEFGNTLDKLASEYAERIYMLAGHEFNINSPKQLGEVLFDELKLPHGKKTKTGYSTGADILEKLRSDHLIVDDILEYRSVTKLRSTYAEGLCKAADSEQRVHSSFNQTITVTGRLSSTEPNLQNIPIRTELGRILRKFFIPKDQDYVLIDADYSQIELRLLAHIADDKRMIDGFISGEDIHRITASQVFGVPLELVTPELRKRAKAVNFGIVYGIGEFSLASDIGVTRKEAGAYIKSYFEKYPQIAAYLTDIVEKAKRDGYVETIFGRRRYIPELSSSKAMLRAFGERVAMNSPIQGSSADIIKLAMIEVSDRLRHEGLDARLILQVHDELIIEANKRDAARAAEILKGAMENVVKLSVPLTVELSCGNSWFECK